MTKDPSFKKAVKKHNVAYRGPLKVEPLTNNDSRKVFKPFYSKQCKVFGSAIVATAGVPDFKLLHACSVWAQYLDNNNDGTPDNKIAGILAKGNATVVMAKDPAE